jgi:hypothetical protein
MSRKLFMNRHCQILMVVVVQKVIAFHVLLMIVMMILKRLLFNLVTLNQNMFYGL